MATPYGNFSFISFFPLPPVCHPDRLKGSFSKWPVLADWPRTTLHAFQENSMARRSNSTDAPAPGKVQTGKPEKPYPDFPLFAHSGRWCKKIRGRLTYFGKWADGWESALARYNAQADALHAGKLPREGEQAERTIKDLCNGFWNAKNAAMRAGEITPRTLDDYERVTDMLVARFKKGRALSDIGPRDFAELRAALAKTNGPVSLANLIQRVRTVFKWGYEAEYLDRPARFGPDFKRPSKKTLRLEKARRGKKLFTAEEIRSMLEAAGPILKAMILLGVNCGFGNSDVGTLPLAAVDLKRGWIEYPRPKTGIERRCPLWPETVESLLAAREKRPAPKEPEAEPLFFVTKYGKGWAKQNIANPIAAETRKLLDDLEIEGRSFYCLRHVFQTQGDEAKDPVATRFIMGHADDSMSATYREDVSDARLRAVAEHVRGWLFGEGVAKHG